MGRSGSNHNDSILWLRERKIRAPRTRPGDIAARGCILQGFPKAYAFVPAGAAIFKKKIGRLIGNAVPVPLGRIIGRSLVRHIEDLTAPRRSAR